MLTAVNSHKGDHEVPTDGTYLTDQTVVMESLLDQSHNKRGANQDIGSVSLEKEI